MILKDLSKLNEILKKTNKKLAIAKCLNCGDIIIGDSDFTIN